MTPPPSAQTARKTRTLRDACDALERIAPLGLAQEWDNVGLLAGDLSAPLRRVLLAIDLSAAVVREAIEKRCELLIAYHPPIFKPIRSLRAPGSGMEALVFRCVRAGVAIYSPHTALDAAQGGTNDVLAGLCGLTDVTALEFVPDPGVEECKLVVFVPHEHVHKVAAAVFDAGGGKIGDYTHCSFRTPGEGTFLGGDTTSPAVGRAGRLEFVKEVRLESVVPSSRLPAVVSAMRNVHPYEEPAFDIYPLRSRPVAGIGRCGRFARPTTLAALARRLRTATKTDRVQVVGEPSRRLEDAVVVAGSAGGLPFRARLTERHVIVTGEIRHHDARTLERIGCAALAVGHWASERPVLASLASRLNAALGVATRISAADADAFVTL